MKMLDPMVFVEDGEDLSDITQEKLETILDFIKTAPLSNTPTLSLSQAVVMEHGQAAYTVSNYEGVIVSRFHRDDDFYVTLADGFSVNVSHFGRKIQACFFPDED